MDKFTIVLDLIEHPDNYSTAQLHELLSDPETREIYTVLCKTDSAIEASSEVDVEMEWKSFSENMSVRRIRKPWFRNRAASITAIIFSSVAAVAAGVAITISISHRPPTPTQIDQETVAPHTLAYDSMNVAATEVSVNTKVTDQIMFENQPLEMIMREVSSIYEVEIKFNNRRTADLHLYYKLNPELSLDQIVEQLNTFDQININRNGNKLIID